MRAAIEMGGVHIKTFCYCVSFLLRWKFTLAIEIFMRKVTFFPVQLLSKESIIMCIFIHSLKKCFSRKTVPRLVFC